ncbi:MAG: hypothetical protein JXR76_07090 [Deltaproteobacteria bacterium]|nr:hypothetical protein [Deltaproteobacteria bacterium]
MQNDLPELQQAGLDMTRVDGFLVRLAASRHAQSRWRALRFTKLVGYASEYQRRHRTAKPTAGTSADASPNETAAASSAIGPRAPAGTPLHSARSPNSPARTTQGHVRRPPPPCENCPGACEKTAAPLREQPRGM